MIKKVKIENFKSVQNMELEMGRLNIVIGENGCGKTNILEGIAVGSAAIENKIDNEFLRARGIRVTESIFMRSAFNSDAHQKNIEIGFSDQRNEWLEVQLVENDNSWDVLLKTDQASSMFFSGRAADLEKYFLKLEGDDRGQVYDEIRNLYRIRDNFIRNYHIYPFLIYAPENSGLRQFQEEGQILPLGIGGEGLFKHLVTLSKQQPEIFVKIKNQLKIIDWFEDLQIPGDLMFTERRLNIKDRFLHPDLQYIDQRSANEGFLYLLFYFTLFISEFTPRFFAIDNIDNALNPKLCIRLIQVLSRLAKEHDKQVIITTHNPSVLDGLDLIDDDQRLFVIYRNADGHTMAKRVQPKAPVNGTENVRLSEAFIRGYLGGLPKNF